MILSKCYLTNEAAILTSFGGIGVLTKSIFRALKKEEKWQNEIFALLILK